MRALAKTTLAATFAIALPTFVRAQSAQGAEDESRQTPPSIATGIGAGTMHFHSGRSQASVSATMQYSPNRWITFSATPGYGRTSLGRTSTTGPSDLPLSVGATRSFSDLSWSPSLSGSLYSSVSLRDSASALGSSGTTFGASAALSGWATNRLNLAIAASRPLSDGGGNSSLDLEGAYSLGKATPNIGFTGEIGRADSGATLARSIAAGVAFSIAGPLTLAIDGSHGLTASAPSWTLSISLGTAFAGLSPLDPSSSLKRLKGVLGSKVSATSGYSKSGSGSRSCKTAGTC